MEFTEVNGKLIMFRKFYTLSVPCSSCRICKGQKSEWANSFFSKSKLTLKKWLLALYWWVREYPVTDMMEEAAVDKGTAMDIYRWLREVWSAKLLATPIQLGDRGVIVQVDESLFRHKPKVRQCQTLLYMRETLYYSIIEGGQQAGKYGYSGWWIPLTLLPLVTWKLFQGEMLQRL